jgi:hypothetical protein
MRQTGVVDLGLLIASAILEKLGEWATIYHMSPYNAFIVL